MKPSQCFWSGRPEDPRRSRHCIVQRRLNSPRIATRHGTKTHSDYPYTRNRSPRETQRYIWRDPRQHLYQQLKANPDSRYRPLAEKKCEGSAGHCSQVQSARMARNQGYLSTRKKTVLHCPKGDGKGIPARTTRIPHRRTILLQQPQVSIAGIRVIHQDDTVSTTCANVQNRGMFKIGKQGVIT